MFAAVPNTVQALPLTVNPGYMRAAGDVRTMWVMRHGEKLDDVDDSWAAQAERPYDPPITDKGKAQVGAPFLLSSLSPPRPPAPPLFRREGSGSALELGGPGQAGSMVVVVADDACRWR
jgi:hypothetical protein